MQIREVSRVTVGRARLQRWTAVWLMGVACSLFCPRPAAAQETEDRRAAALVLFEQGRELAAQGNHAAACGKFDAASRLTHSAGILLNLADCYEKTGRTASAWAVFRDAAGAAARSGRDLEEAEARKRQQALAGKLPHLQIDVPAEHRLVGALVRRDGQLVVEAAWGTSLPADPGEHVIEVTAPGHDTWRVRVQTKAGLLTRVIVPRLEPSATTASAATENRPEAPVGTRMRRISAATLAGVGLAGLAAGTFLGLSAKAQYDDDKARCERENVCDSNAARRRGNLATVATAVGAASLLGGTVLWFVLKPARTERDVALRIGTQASIAAPSVLVEGAFQ